MKIQSKILAVFLAMALVVSPLSMVGYASEIEAEDTIQEEIGQVEAGVEEVESQEEEQILEENEFQEEKKVPKLRTDISLLAAVVNSGSFGSGLTWTLYDDGTMVISGNGAMPNYSSYNDQPWKDYWNSITSIVVNEGITHIGNLAFMNSFANKSIKLPSTLKTIGTGAFNKNYNTGETGELVLPAGIESIGKQAFTKCLFSSVTYEGSTTRENSNISEDTILFEFPSSLVSIEEKAFQQCFSTSKANASIIVPANITTLGANAFYPASDTPENHVYARSGFAPSRIFQRSFLH